MDGFYKTYTDIIETIEESLEKGRIVPSLILLYSAIDSFSSFAEKSNHSGKSIFKSWVRTWMLSKYPLPCNEDDIYAARCGLLHQQAGESTNSKKGEAKEIYYSWGHSDPKEFEQAVKNLKNSESLVAVKIEDLFWSFRKGMIDCKNEIEKDESWKNKFTGRAKKLFINISA